MQINFLNILPPDGAHFVKPTKAASRTVSHSSSSECHPHGVSTTPQPGPICKKMPEASPPLTISMKPSSTFWTQLVWTTPFLQLPPKNPSHPVESVCFPPFPTSAPANWLAYPSTGACVTAATTYPSTTRLCSKSPNFCSNN